MSEVNTLHETPDASPAGGAFREFAREYAHALRATAMVDANRWHPACIRDLYLDDASQPRIPAASPAFEELNEDFRRMHRIAAAWKFAGLAVVLGMLASVALAAA